MMKNSFFVYAICIFLTFYFIRCEKQVIQKDGMVLIKGEGDIKDYWLDVSPVTVGAFNKFVRATHYKTQAERFGDGGVFNFKTGTWELVKGANWLYPFGKDSSKAIANHPVTQVSWNDALVYCRWTKKRLPNSQEFIFAEKNGEKIYEKTYTWGMNFIENGKYKANFWQGVFPLNNTVEDGFLTTSPVGYFGKNNLGLTDVGGNVWQWCSDNSDKRQGEKMQRGGSFLCDPMVCHGFKIGGQSSSTPETSLCHVGFRCAKNAF
jgi:formylglycine-generating enzyme